jgi:glycosyltransferase EpsJ
MKEVKLFMNKKEKNIIYNKKYILIVPYDYSNISEIKYSFENVMHLNTGEKNAKELLKYINNNNICQIIFVNYMLEYNYILLNLQEKHKIKFIFTYSLAGFSDPYVYDKFNRMWFLFENKIINNIGFLDYGLYNCLINNNYNVNYILLDVAKPINTQNIINNDIGIISEANDPKQNFYNQLSAIKLINGTAKIKTSNDLTKQFVDIFKININSVENYEKLIKDNLVNLYINFTSTENTKVLQSMDNNVPCILGNTTLFDNYPYLKSLLVVESDDDIDEIANKILLIKKERNQILKVYQEFRKNYSEKSIKSIKDFLEANEKSIAKNDLTIPNDELLLSVIVPVYNTSEYLSDSLNSIIKAKINNMEILIINDGSTDNSESIINNFTKKYPKLIRYIKQDNKGLGNVRNVGLIEAKGKYIASIDSDDTIDSSFFKDAIKYLKDDVDIIVCDWLSINGENRFLTPAIDNIFINKNKYEGLLYTTIMPSTCNKIIKKSIYKQLSIKYIEDKYEDFSTNPFLLFFSQKIVYLNKPYYKYFIRDKSIMRTQPGYSMINIIKIVNERLINYKKYINVDLDELKYYMFSWRIEEYIINQIYDIEENKVSNFIEYMNKNIKDILIDMFENKYYISMINLLKNSKEKEYINNRNKSIINNNFEKFIINSRRKNNYYKLTANVIYYGE